MTYPTPEDVINKMIELKTNGNTNEGERRIEKWIGYVTTTDKNQGEVIIDLN